MCTEEGQQDVEKGVTTFLPVKGFSTYLDHPEIGKGRPSPLSPGGKIREVPCDGVLKDPRGAPHMPRKQKCVCLEDLGGSDCWLLLMLLQYNSICGQEIDGKVGAHGFFLEVRNR